MSLTPFQKAGLRQHIHNKSQILNDDGTAAIDGGSAAIDAAIAAHAAASDPHPGYDTAAEVAAALAALPAGFTNPMTTSGDIIYEGGGVDQARTGTATSPTGTAGGGGDPANIIDGDDGTVWISGGEGIPDITFVVDLGSAKTIASWRMLLYAVAGFARAGANTLLESSPDNVTWTLRDTYASTGGVETGVRVLSASATARYWRVRNPDNTGTRFGLYSLSVFDAVVPSRLPKGTTGQVLAQGAAAPVWEAAPRAAYAGVKAHFSSGSFGTGSYAPIPLAGTEDWDTAAFHDPVTNNTRLTVPVGMGGKYRVSFLIYTATQGYAYIRKNGTTIAWGYTYLVGTSGTFVGNGSTVLDLADGDYLELMLNVASGVMQSDTVFGMDQI